MNSNAMSRLFLFFFQLVFIQPSKPVERFYLYKYMNEYGKKTTK